MLCCEMSKCAVGEEVGDDTGEDTGTEGVDADAREGVSVGAVK